MKLLRIHQFLVSTDLELVCDSDLASTPGIEAGVPLNVLLRPGMLRALARTEATVDLQDGLFKTFATRDGVLLQIGFHILIHITADGETITVDVEDSLAHRNAAGVCVLHFGLAVASLLRGYLPLHASSVDLNGSRIAFSAPSGSGKSTLLWELLHTGALFVSDDMLPVKPIKMASYFDVQAWPSISLLPKLSVSSLRRHRPMAQLADYEPIFPSSEKFWTPLPTSWFSNNPRPLRALFFIHTVSNASDSMPADSDVRIEPLTGMNAVRALIQSNDGAWALSGLGDSVRLMRSYLHLIRTVPIFRLSYPKRYDILPSVIQSLSICLANITDGATQ